MLLRTFLGFLFGVYSVVLLLIGQIIAPQPQVFPFPAPVIVPFFEFVPPPIDRLNEDVWVLPSENGDDFQYIRRT